MGAFDFVGDFLGGSSKTQTTQSGPPQWASGYWKNVFDLAERQIGGENAMGGPIPMPPYYPGSTVAGFNPTQTGAMYGLGSAAIGGQQNLADVARARSVLQMTQGGNPYMDPNFLTTLDAIGGQATRNFTGSVLPQLDLGALQAGQFGGGRQGVVQNEAVDRFGQSLGEELSKFGSQAYATNLDATMRALALAPETQAMQAVPMQNMLNIGNLQQQQAQNELNADVERWNYEQSETQRAIDRYNAQVIPALGLGTTTQTEGPRSSPLLQAAGGALQGAMVGAMIPGLGPGAGAGIGALIGLFG